MSKQMTNAATIAAEFAALLFPMAICQTKFLYPFGICVLLFELSLGFFLCALRLRSSTTNIPTQSRGDGTSPENNCSSELATKPQLIPFLSAYRSSVSYLTFVAILAVDFHVFPRRFAKTETSGYGLMDLGAGSYVVAGGLVSLNARDPATKVKKSKFGANVRLSLVRLIPLTVLGFLRMATNKGIEYQEHASEYGTHWNFFFTLASIGLLSTLLGPNGLAAASSMRRFFPFFLLSAYQIALSRLGLQTFIEEAPRFCVSHQWPLCDVFAANREGLLGCVGYLGLFLIAEEIGRFCLWSCHEETKRQGKRLASCSVVLWLLHFVLTQVCGIPVSRRSTNFSFVIWIVAHNSSLLFLIWLSFYIAEAGACVVDPSPMFSAVNTHGLLVFLIANLMTGFVNITTNTLIASDAKAMLILVGYLLFVGGAALLLDWLVPTNEKQKSK